MWRLSWPAGPSRVAMHPPIIFEPNPRPQEIDRLGEGINTFSVPAVGPSKRVYLTYFVKDEAGEILAGVHGNMDWGWLYISALWVDESLRGTGLGRALMRRAEEAAVDQGCTHAYLQTMSYQAPDFYTKLGYAVFAELEDIPPPHRCIFFRKRLGN